MHVGCIENDVRVCTTIPKGVDTSSLDGSVGWPSDVLGDNLDVPLIKLDLRIDGLDADCGWDFSSLQGEDNLDDAGDTTCCFTASCVRLVLVANRDVLTCDLGWS
jgi:hypothetical protein